MSEDDFEDPFINHEEWSGFGKKMGESIRLRPEDFELIGKDLYRVVTNKWQEVYRL